MANFNLEIISPTGIIFKGECHLAVVPSVSGDIGVMYDHEPVIANLREGKVSIYDSKETLIKEFEVKTGVAEVQDPGKLLVLIDS